MRHTPDPPDPGASAQVFAGGSAVIRIGLAAWAIGTALLSVGAVLDREQLFFSYLIAYAYAVSIAVGALIFLMVCHAMRAGWPVAVRRLTEAVVAVFPVLAVLFVPLGFGLGTLYPWLHPDRYSNPVERDLIVHKLAYLNIPGFLFRTAVFFVIWGVTSSLLRRWSFMKDDDRNAAVETRLYTLSAVALPAVALAVSFAAFDWLMSLTPIWFSTMYPIYFFAGGFVAALALVTLLTFVARERLLLPHVSTSHYYALGRLLLAFTIFWGYAAFFQFMLIWMANKPDEVVYYLARIRGGWRTMTVVVVLGQFVVPFCFLLSYRLKREGRWLAGIAAWILVAHYFDVHWLVAPTARPDRFPLHWLDLASLMCVGGLCTTAGLLSLRGRRLIPIHDPRLADAIAYQST
jgi:hypothetical protein